MSSDYDFVNTSKLRLKDDKNQKKKKKKKSQDSKKLSQTLSKLGDNKLAQELAKLVEKDDKAEQILEQIAEKELVKPEPTKAEIAFKNMQEKKQMERILKKASKSHKQRVEDFNNHLDSLSEHYDIPKVSWTK